MSKFSNYLKDLIERSGETIAFISRTLNIERTSIHKALADERILPYSAVQALAHHFELPLDERQEFFRLYDIQLQGEEAYQNRQTICDFLNTLSAIDFKMPAPPEVTSIPEKDQMIRGEYAIHSLIRSILIYESAHISNAEFYLFLPPRLNLTMELMELWLNNRDFSVTELLYLQTTHKSQNDSNNRKDLQKLGSVIPLCLASRGKYKPYAFTFGSQATMIYPLSHYIITPEYLILIAEDLSTAQVFKNEPLVFYYRNYFLSLVQNCELWVQCSSNIMDVLQEYLTGTSPDRLQILMAHPCPGRYITPELIKKYMKAPNLPYDTMFHLVEKHFSVLRNIQKNYVTIFSEKGLEAFIQNGILQDLPPQYVPPLEPSDVKMMLTELYKETENGTITSLIVRPTVLQIPEYLSIYATSQAGLHLYTTNSFVFGAYSSDIHISDISLCKIFSDFFMGLSGSPMVYSKEETLSLLKQYISLIP
nr:hypothetical protein [uncultured Blautia sp.]